MWLLPSRGRPNLLRRFFEIYENTKASTAGIVIIDHDDPEFYNYVNLHKKFPKNWRLRANNGANLTDIYNNFYTANDDLLWYGLLSDDCVPETEEWDTKLINAAGTECISYGDDGIRGNYVNFGVLGGDLVRQLGHIMLPGTSRLYSDDYLMEIGRRRKCLRYLPDVKMTHYHFSNGKAPYDDTYKKPFAAQDKKVFEEWLSKSSV